MTDISANDDLATDLCWTVEGIAKSIGRTTRQTRWMIQNGRLPVKRVGRTMVASKAALREALTPAE
jgi:hypothetical protein